jgi:hypothetical protein
MAAFITITDSLTQDDKERLHRCVASPDPAVDDDADRTVVDFLLEALRTGQKKGCHSPMDVFDPLDLSDELREESGKRHDAH